MHPLIELVDVTKTYITGEIEQSVLKGIHVTINTGELVAIMGASGSGKTTLMNIIGILDSASTGRYLLDNRDITDLNEDERAQIRNQSIGFIFQSFFLLPRLTILENVSLPLYYRRTPEAEMRDRSFNMLKKVGLENHIHHRPNQLSGGQQQRAAIARALVGTPRFLLADEPTGALDSKTGQMIMDLFKELNQNEKVTMIIVTHDPRIAEQCQRTVHIKDGKLI